MNHLKYDICVLGLGYIGLPTASILSTKGKSVLGVDVNRNVVDTINNGQIHIEEPDLDLLVKAAVGSGNLKAATSPSEADVFIIAVPTPLRKDDDHNSPDLTYIENATRSIAPVVKQGDLIILESTSPVGTTEKVRSWLIDELKKLGNEEASERNYFFAHCPERILPGQMLQELVTNDRIAGGLTTEAAIKAKALYESFCTAEILLTDSRTAEMAKLTENAFRDVNIAFANELSIICDKLGIDVWELILLSNKHPRVNILNPGPGVGGHCIAVDPWFIVSSASKESQLIHTARKVNESKPDHVLRQIQRRADRLKSPVIACLGLAFKANVDDLRESPALEITEQVSKISDSTVLVAEPYIDELPGKLRDRCELMDAEEAIKAADIVVLLVDHKIFANLSKPILAERMIIDTRGFWK